MSDILASVFKKTRACSHLIITHLTTQSTPYENNLAQLTLRYSEWLQQQKHTLSRARFIPSDAKSAHTYNDDTQSSRMDNRSEQTSAPEDPVWTALITAADPAYKAAQELLRHSTETSNFFTEDQLREIFTLVCAIRCAQAAQEHNWSIFFQNLDDGFVMGGMSSRENRFYDVLRIMEKHGECTFADERKQWSSYSKREDDSLIDFRNFQQAGKFSNPLPVLERESTWGDLMEYVRRDLPVVIRGLYTYAEPALSECLTSIQHRYVPVEKGRNYAAEDWSIGLMLLKDVFTAIRNQDDIYLAQYPLALHLPQVNKFLTIPQGVQCLARLRASASPNLEASQLGADLPSLIQTEARVVRHFWLGPAKTVSPFHQDPDANLFLQVAGVKYFQLCAASETALAPFAVSSSQLSNTTSFPTDFFTKNTLSPEDLTQHPQLRHLGPRYTARLHPGDAIYIPPKWWHMVVAESNSFSINHWLV